MAHGDLKKIAADGQRWRSDCRAGVQCFTARFASTLEERRRRRRFQPAAAVNGDHVCEECGKPYASRLGLLSHSRVHRTNKRTPSWFRRCSRRA